MPTTRPIDQSSDRLSNSLGETVAEEVTDRRQR